MTLSSLGSGICKSFRKQALLGLSRISLNFSRFFCLDFHSKGEDLIVPLDRRLVVYPGAAGVDEGAGVICSGAGVDEGAGVDKGAGVDEGAGVVCPGSCDILILHRHPLLPWWPG